MNIHLDKVLSALMNPDVSDVTCATARRPCLRINGAYQPIDEQVMTSDALLTMLAAAGAREELSNVPIQWTFRRAGVGIVGVAAAQINDEVRARFAVVKREEPLAPAMAPEAFTVPIGAAEEFVPPSSADSFGADPLDGAPAPPASGVSTIVGAIANAIEVAPHAAPSGARVTAANAAGQAVPVVEDPASSAVVPVQPRFDIPFDGTLESLLELARSALATDLHIVAERPTLLRVAGALKPAGEPLDPDRVNHLIYEIVPPRLMDTFEREGSVDFAYESPTHGRFRVNVTRQRTGLKACFRIIAGELPTLDRLGLPEGIAKATHHHQGLIVITGPSGHGKTTTLTALVDHINRETKHHIITVEDPVEYVHPRKNAMISQREVGTQTRTFGSALKASLREDPDVIVIGELRDTETVRIALTASETGHLVIGTMNTPSAGKTIERLVDLFPPGDQQQVRLTLAGGLKLVVSQRLIPTTDGSGVVAAVEILPGCVPLWNLIRDNRTFQIPSLQQRGKAIGITRFDDSLADLVLQGKTTLAQALPFAESPHEFEARFQPKPAQPVMMDHPSSANFATVKAKDLLGKAGNLFGKK